jgi:hypothetical protein
MSGISAMLLGVALAAAAETSVALPDPTRPYAYATAIEVDTSVRTEGVQWRLNGIRIREGERSAILNGRVVKPGDSLAGARVLEIHPAEVVLEQDAQKIVVKLVLSNVKKHSATAATPEESKEDRP